MGSGGNKVMENKPQDTQVKQAIAETKTVTPFEEYQADQLAKWSGWENAAGPKDITSAPGMSDYLDVYGNANALAAQQRVGDPSHAFSANLPGFTDQLQQQQQMRMYNTRAQALSDAFRGAKASALGAGAQAAQLETGRLNEYAGLMNNYNSAYYGRPQQVPLWKQIAGIAMQGLT